MKILPLSFIRIWCRKNDCAVDFKLGNGDSFRADAKGVYIVLPDESQTPVNVRHVFPVKDRYPVLVAADMYGYDPQMRPFLHAQPGDPRSKRKRVYFDDILSEVTSYLSLLGERPEIEKYIAVRLCDSGRVSVLQLNAAANRQQQGETLGAAVLRMGFCTWEQMLAVCLDVDQIPGGNKATAAGGYELSGEILVALNKITRTQLEHALKLKREGARPLGEILVQMGACSSSDVKTCLAAQESISEKVIDSVGLLGDLLVQHGRITPDELTEALRLQRIGRQPLSAVLVSMGACGKNAIVSFKQEHGIPQSSDNYDEQALIRYLLGADVITQRQVEEARRIQLTGRQVLGELLVATKVCTQEDVELALNLQQHYRRTRPAGKRREKLGEILIKRSLVEPDVVDKATRVQALGKQKMGATLISLGACSQADFADALELQFNWREYSKQVDDKLGQELLRNGLLEEASLNRALELHGRAGKPLGEILVEQHVCMPEALIDTMLRRDERRRMAFANFIKHMRPAAYVGKHMGETARASAKTVNDLKERQAGVNLVDRISAWLQKRG